MQAKPGEGQESTQSWTVDVQHKVKAPREKVWAFYTDHVSWPKWTEMADKVTLDPPGDLTPNGAGVSYHSFSKSLLQIVPYNN